jgi:tRNA threonylcarbamoyladenosine biosynthesis protein TsaB
MSFVLGIDTSSVELGMGLTNEQQPVVGVSRYIRNSHAEHISRTVLFLLESCAIKPSDISHAAIAVGPGSFTGLRIGISFLKGFCFGTGIRVLPVSSLESMATSWQCLDRPIISAFDARNGEVFWARFEPHGETVKRRTDDCLSSLDIMKSAMQDGDTVLIDTLGYVKSSVFQSFSGRPRVYAVERHPLQRGLACAKAGMRALGEPDVWINAEAILPRYLSATTMEKRLAARV